MGFDDPALRLQGFEDGLDSIDDVFHDSSLISFGAAPIWVEIF